MTQIELEEKIVAAQNDYYAGHPTMSDADFDTLWDTLGKLYPDSELLKEVGSDLGETNGFKKVKLDSLMGSQSKANTAEEMDIFLAKNPGEIMETYKMDGSSVELKYVDGQFVRGCSRGNGTIGVDYTENIKKMNGVPLKLKKPLTLIVKGEVVLSETNKKKYFPNMANKRNAATGIYHRMDGVDCDKLDIVAWDVRSDEFKTQVEIFKFLEDNGFIATPHRLHKTLTGKESINRINEVWDNELPDYEYDIDGLVFKANKINFEDLNTNYRPESQVALKPARTIVKTTLKDIEWRLTNGTFTPVAHIEPVVLLGATISRASLANVGIMEELGIEIGDEIEICRCGEIIPKVIRNVRTGKIARGYENSYNN